MPVEVILPKVDMDMESGQISRWFAKEGDSVAKGQVLFEIETDKAAMEVDAPSSGILRDVTAEEGVKVPVGQAVAWIYAEGEAYQPGSGKAAEPAPVTAEAAKIEPQAAMAAVPVKAAEPTTSLDTNGVRATPLARRLAREAGIELGSLQGSGPKGRIQKRDVEAKAGRADRGVSLPPVPVPATAIPATADAALNTAWLRRGNDPKRAPIVLIHGFGSDLNSWRPMLTGGTLDNAILAVDLPGHGDSPRSVPNDLDAMATLLEQAIAPQHAGPIILVAHSFGGAIATEIAARGNLDVRALTLIAPAGLGPEINGAFLNGFVRSRSEASLTAWMKLLVQDESLLTGPFVNATLAQSQDEGLRDAQQRIADRFFADGTQILDVRQTLANLRIPIRVIFGAGDRIIPPQHATGLPGEIAIHLFAGTGHMPQLEQREKVMRIIGEVSRSVA